MSKQSERDEFIALVTKEGLPVDVARKVLSAAKTLHRIAELECSSEAADRDRVPCIATEDGCLCRDHGNYDSAAGEHGDVPRIAVQSYRIERRIEKLLKPYDVRPVFNGDPRGPSILLKVPSGKTNDWGSRGIAVP